MKRLFCLALPLVLAACQSKAPLNYYTLTQAPATAPTATAAPFRFAVQGVSVPAQVDQPQLVVRQGDGIVLLENERWIAPLSDEIRSALSADLSARFGSLDLGDTPRGEGPPVLRLAFDVRRFDSAPGRYVQLDSLWTLRLATPGGDRVLTCGARLQMPAGSSYDQLVDAHRQLLAQLASRVDPVARRFVANGGQATCPPL